MAYYRTHWVETTDLTNVHEAVQDWTTRHADRVPNFFGVFAGNDIDDTRFNWVSIQAGEPTAFLAGGGPEVRSLTSAIETALGSSLNYRDSVDLTHVAPRSPGLAAVDASGDGGSCSMWFEVSDVDVMRQVTDAWQERHAEAGLGESWLGKELSGERVFNMAAHFATVADMRSGVRFFDELAESLEGTIVGVPERHCMRAPSVWAAADQLMG